MTPTNSNGNHKGFVLSYVGPVSACAAALRKRTIDIGVTELVICPDTIGENSYERTMEGLRMFARQVMPQLKAFIGAHRCTFLKTAWFNTTSIKPSAARVSMPANHPTVS